MDSSPQSLGGGGTPGGSGSVTMQATAELDGSSDGRALLAKGGWVGA